MVVPVEAPEIRSRIGTRKRGLPKSGLLTTLEAGTATPVTPCRWSWRAQPTGTGPPTPRPRLPDGWPEQPAVGLPCQRLWSRLSCGRCTPGGVRHSPGSPATRRDYFARPEAGLVETGPRPATQLLHPLSEAVDLRLHLQSLEAWRREEDIRELDTYLGRASADRTRVDHVGLVRMLLARPTATLHPEDEQNDDEDCGNAMSPARRRSGAIPVGPRTDFRGGPPRGGRCPRWESSGGVGSSGSRSSNHSISESRSVMAVSWADSR